MSLELPARRLTVFVAPDVARALRIAATDSNAALVNAIEDAAESYLDAVRAGRGGVPRHPTPADVELSVPVPSGLDAVLRQIGQATSSGATRPEIIRASLEAHYGPDPGAEAALSADGTVALHRDHDRRVAAVPIEPRSDPLASREVTQSTGAQAPRGRPPLPDATRKSRRAQSRLQAFVGSQWVIKSRLDVAALQPPDPATVEPLGPAEVRVGLSESAASSVDALVLNDVLPSMAHKLPGEHPRAPLDGLTNRIAPTLWAAAQLAEELLRAEEMWIAYGDFIAAVIPRAWTIGIGLRDWEEGHGIGRRSFVSSARWPSLPAEGSTDVRERRQASTVLGFINHSLIGIRGTQMTGAVGVGPLDSLGLVQVAVNPQRGGLFLSIAPAAISFLNDMGSLSVSCSYPHSPPAWDCFSRFLSQQNPLELQRMRELLRLMEESQSRVDLHRRAVGIFKPGVDPDSGEAELAVLQPSLVTAVSGMLARLREWGLATIGPSAFGTAALTPLGKEEAGK